MLCYSASMDENQGLSQVASLSLVDQEEGQQVKCEIINGDTDNCKLTLSI